MLIGRTRATSPFGMRDNSIGGIGPITYKVTPGTLPTGPSLNSSTGVISGKPTVAKTITIAVKAIDSVGAETEMTYTLSNT